MKRLIVFLFLFIFIGCSEDTLNNPWSSYDKRMDYTDEGDGCGGGAIEIEPTEWVKYVWTHPFNISDFEEYYYIGELMTNGVVGDVMFLTPLTFAYIELEYGNMYAFRVACVAYVDDVGAVQGAKSLWSTFYTPILDEGPIAPIAHYVFEAGAGAVVYDVSGFGEPLNLFIEDVNSIMWVEGGGIEITSPTILKTALAANKIINYCVDRNEITISITFSTSDMGQSGPARIMSLSQDPYNRNFTLGQDSGNMDMRLRTTSTSDNGIPSTSVGFDAGRTWYFYTKDSGGNVSVYIDGSLVYNGNVSGDMSNWDPAYYFALGNELTEDRPWLGTIYEIKIYDREMKPFEVLSVEGDREIIKITK